MLLAKHVALSQFMRRCGTGIVSKALVEKTKALGCQVVALDLSPFAVETAAETLKPTNAEIVRMNLLRNFRDSSIDVTVFNPPYLPSEPEETRAIVDMAWAGGHMGTVTTEQFLQCVWLKLAPSGVVYLLLEERNEPERFLAKHASKFDYVLVRRRSVPGEKLSIWRLLKK